MAATYEPIATQTLASTATTITFSSIPSTYTDLIIASIVSISSLTDIKIRFNSDTGTNYSETGFLGNGSSPIATRGSNMTYLSHAYTNTTLGISYTFINNYSSTTTFKTSVNRWNSPTSSDPYAAAYVGLWRNTAAISTITLTSSGNISVGSTFTLYGIKAA